MLLQRVREGAHNASAAVFDRPSHGRSLQSHADYIQMVSNAVQPRRLLMSKRVFLYQEDVTCSVIVSCLQNADLS